MSLNKRIHEIRSLLPRTMLRDREILSRRLHLALRKETLKGDREALGRFLRSIEDKALASVEERKLRLRSRPRVTFPESLPITSKREQIVRLIEENQVVVVSGETGCGKSTQIPKMCLEAGSGAVRGVQDQVQG